jgi:hypothetical protein
MRLSLGKWVGAAAALGLTVGMAGLSPAASARAARGAEAPAATEPDRSQAYESVESIPMLTSPYSWSPVDNDTLIVWTSPFQPYLVELSFPSHDMRWVEQIGVTSVGARSYAKFDSVQIRGFRYPIRAIYKMSREEARNFERGA